MQFCLSTTSTLNVGLSVWCETCLRALAGVARPAGVTGLFGQTVVALLGQITPDGLTIMIDQACILVWCIEINAVGL